MKISTGHDIELSNCTVHTLTKGHFRHLKQSVGMGSLESERDSMEAWIECAAAPPHLPPRLLSTATQQFAAPYGKG